MEFPTFKYHPDPLATGAIVTSNEVCQCCEQQNGYIYNSILYAEEEVEFICPWCIADGSAAHKFEGHFSDAHPLLSNGVPKDVVLEICERTPGYNSWQQEYWESHCETACEFHGDADKTDLLNLNVQE